MDRQGSDFLIKNFDWDAGKLDFHNFLRKYDADLAIKERSNVISLPYFAPIFIHMWSVCKKNSDNSSAVLPVILRSLFFCW